MLMKSFYNHFTKITYTIFLYAFGIILPLYFNDLYFDMMSAKANIYFLFTKILIIPVLIILILKLILKKFNKKEFVLTILLLILLITSFISCIFARNIEYAFTGEKGWYIGFLTIASIIVYIVCFKDIRLKEIYYYPLIICVAFIYLCGILHSFEIDVLGLHENILAVSYHKYLSTIGNINWYTGYLALTVPLFVGLYLKEIDKKKKLIFSIVSILGVISISMLGSDGIFLGLGVLSFFIVPYIFSDKEKVNRFSILIFFFDLGLLFARILNYCIDGYANLLRRLIVILPILLLAIILFIFSKYIKEETYKKISSKVIISIEILLIVSVLIFIILAINKNDNEWGTGRIAIFIDSLKLYVNLPLKEQILGIGEELLYLIYRPLNERYNGIYLSSHSEWIQLLLTGGIINVVSYQTCWLYVFYTFLKQKTWKNNTPMYFGLICYFGQSFVNSMTIVNVAILSIILTIFIAKEIN